MIKLSFRDVNEQVQVQGHDINTLRIQALFSCLACILPVLRGTTAGLAAAFCAAFPQAVAIACWISGVQGVSVAPTGYAPRFPTTFCLFY